MAAHNTETREPRKMPPFLNSIMKLVLRSPFRGKISEQIMLLTFVGRKSGKQYTIPVGYRKVDNTLTCFTDHQWWKNLRDNAPVTVLIAGKTLQGTANIYLDKHETTEELAIYVQRLSGASRAFGIEKNADGTFNRQSIEDAAQRFTMIRIQLS